MKSILVAALALFKAHFFKDIKMSIEYHLLKPSIGVFLWISITDTLGAISKDKDTFSNTRNEFYKEYALPIGQSLGYDGVIHDIHFDRDFFSPYHTVNDKKVYPIIKSHYNYALKEVKEAYNILTLMEKELLKATKILPELYMELLKKK